MMRIQLRFLSCLLQDILEDAGKGKKSNKDDDEEEEEEDALEVPNTSYLRLVIFLLP
jgi:hypothetical protein